LLRLKGCGGIVVIILLSLLASGAQAQASGNQKLLKAPVGSFVFDASLGNPAPPITVWYYRPNQVDPGTRVVFLMHGSSRTGQEARIAASKPRITFASGLHRAAEHEVDFAES
jgi:poly(3-hydroxybutyrate) depolymerase